MLERRDQSSNLCHESIEIQYVTGHFTHNFTEKVHMTRPCDILHAIKRMEKFTMFIIVDCASCGGVEAATGREAP
ncbi:hypothetical protein BN2476_500010 [Paraburkholderia piptadeniae]|uniref:Uncharacterized protein n=1 Tax=Paraburkholderia piptadeniae TaxID=1701573 RepID=A0A1N7SF67_9BURK|nr:hypothetical protein BN2476_500010 [Paraburkholderia piptadeniae]